MESNLFCFNDDQWAKIVPHLPTVGGGAIIGHGADAPPGGGHAERELIRSHNREALETVLAQGIKLAPGRGRRGGRPDYTKGTEGCIRAADRRAEEVKVVIDEIVRCGAATPVDIADGLNERGVRTAKGAKWQSTQVKRIMARLERLSAAATDSLASKPK